MDETVQKDTTVPMDATAQKNATAPMDETVQVDGIQCKLIREGNTSIYQPETVFYNPAQEFNRDLSVLVLDTYLQNELWKRSKKGSKYESKQLNVLDALSASGLRGIRYARELVNREKIHKVYMNDLSLNAVKVMHHNVKSNGLEERIQIENYDANFLMYKAKYETTPFLAIDLDPYGCAGPFLDAAVQGVLDGGLLMITATDVAILCGNTPETCFAKYGSMPMKGGFCHEFALRILLRAIDSAALKYGRYMVPLLSLSVDFYVRVFVQIFTGPNEAKKSANKTSMVYRCSGCADFKLFEFCTHSKNQKSKHPNTAIKFSLPIGPPVERKCTICGSNYRMAGPVWNGRLHDYEFIEMAKKNLEAGVHSDEEGRKRFGTYRRMRGMLYLAGEELPDCPFFFSLNEIKTALRFGTIPSADFRSAILNAGYQVSQSHTNADSFKTDAPAELIWDIILTWVRADDDKGENGDQVEEEKAEKEEKAEEEEKAEKEEKAKKEEKSEEGSGEPQDPDDEEAMESNDQGNNQSEKNGHDQGSNQINNHQGKKDRRPPSNPMILNRKVQTAISFEYNPKEMPQSKRMNLLRFQMNPTKFWGPKSFPKLSENAPDKVDKRAQNQNKRKRKREESSGGGDPLPATDGH